MLLLEVSTERRVVRWAKKNGVLQSKFTPAGQRGWPDRIFWVAGGRPLLVEFKRKGKQLQKLQQHVVAQLESLNYDICWTDNYEEAIAAIQRALDAAQVPRKGN